MPETLEPKAEPEAVRVRTFDWLRGGAAILMIQHHAEDLLRPGLRRGAGYDLLDRVDGLVAPAFLLTAGFALGLTQVRAGGDLGRAGRSFRRSAEVLLAATFVNWMWFPVFREPHWLWRIDILHCIGLSLLLLLPLAVWGAHRPRSLTLGAGGLGLLAFVAAPFAERVRGPLAPFVNVESGAVFPLLPWFGYLAFGLVLGGAAARSRRALRHTLLALGALGIAVYLGRPLWLAWLPAHDFWRTDPSTHGDRWALVCGLALGLLAVETRWPAARGPRLLALFSGFSLSAYVLHEALLYHQVFGFSFQSRFGERCGWGDYWLLTAALAALTLAGCVAIDRGADVFRTILRALCAGRARSSLPSPTVSPKEPP